MANVYCHACGRPLGDEELFCPHCGAAQLPQVGSKAELQKELDRLSPRPVPWMLAGGALGLLVGIAVAYAGLEWFPKEGGLSPADQGAFGLVIASGVIAGVCVGALVGQIVHRRRTRRRPRGPGAPGTE